MDFRKLFFLPINASAHGHEIDLLIYLIHLLMFGLFFGWAAYFIFVIYRFRKARNPKADYKGLHSHVPTSIEVAVAVIEGVLLLAFSIPFWVRQVNAFPNRPDKIEIRVVAEQFAWNIHYPGADGIFGKMNVKYFDKQSNPLGLDPKDPYSKDDIVTINQMHVPIGRPVVIRLSSKDVVHSFSIPVMRVKQDAIPGLDIPLWFTPTKTGKWEIACAQLCGVGHYSMRGFITVHSQADYDKWLQEQAAASGSDGESGGEDDFWN
ncbi:MAG: cytochrome c oxidase subunit II [Candidatus Omnitrophota bacterium]|nr:cytochrome c oxidase subunit II [Candidatus Omnitrophota bacterium]MDZ4242689.1 cytochrome c oxidase subunit II [Candidatus Omnitrophota bacterium]